MSAGPRRRLLPWLVLGAVTLVAGCPWIKSDEVQDRLGTFDGGETGQLDTGTPETGDTDTDDTDDTDTGGGADADGDGFVSIADGGTDCDDTRANVHPGAEESCDGLDGDCDGDVDEDAVDAPTWYRDADGDGYGDGNLSTIACTAPSGYAAYAGDCDDADAAYNPGAAETDCTDPNDYNCDGSTGSADADGDGYYACEECDDADATAYPGAVEVCDGADDDCDGLVDEDAADAQAWYADADADGYGDASSVTRACDRPAGHVATAGDCDDGQSTVNPGGVEDCDGTDDDCDGGTDETDAAGCTTYYYDADGDGQGTSSSACLCAPGSGYTATNASDCDDGDARAYSGAAETCDGADNDCDGTSDPEGTSGCTTYYGDGDGDGYGSTSSQCLCAPSASHSATNASDCDDANAAVHPGATEVCDYDVDNDCDGTSDPEGSSGCGTYYYDRDLDGYGSTDVRCACDGSSGDYVDNSDDCNDGNAAVSPAATEVCGDSDDNDCDGSFDEGGASGCTVYYEDRDGDGYGQSTSECLCAPSAPFTSSANTDCDDYQASTYPGAPESTDGVDSDCDGLDG